MWNVSLDANVLILAFPMNILDGHIITAIPTQKRWAIVLDADSLLKERYLGVATLGKRMMAFA